MSATEQKLVELAVAEFPNLTEAEAKLLRAAATGDPADYQGPTDGENDPKHAETWDELRTIRARIIRWLCVDREAVKHIEPKGIRIEAAKIIDQLNFEAVTIPFPAGPHTLRHPRRHKPDAGRNPSAEFRGECQWAHHWPRSGSAR